ncbi:MAG: hypothetical protein LUD73_02920 [Lachnospiraceae bacterium]|nr:hypothetical protein [Lachnospiraceae bacterium]
MKALTEALGSIGVAKFMQQYNINYGDYTTEKQKKPDISFDEIDRCQKTEESRAALREMQTIFSDDKGWGSEEAMMTDMAASRREHQTL